MIPSFPLIEVDTDVRRLCCLAANMTSSMSQSNATEELMGLMKNSNQTNATQGNLMGLIEKGISSSGMENMTKDKLYDLQSSK